MKPDQVCLEKVSQSHLKDRVDCLSQEANNLHHDLFTISARIDFNGCRFPLSLRGSLSFANISNKWQDFTFVIIHLKKGFYFKKY